MKPFNAVWLSRTGSPGSSETSVYRPIRLHALLMLLPLNQCLRAWRVTSNDFNPLGPSRRAWAAMGIFLSYPLQVEIGLGSSAPLLYGLELYFVACSVCLMQDLVTQMFHSFPRLIFSPTFHCFLEIAPGGEADRRWRVFRCWRCSCRSRSA